MSSNKNRNYLILMLISLAATWLLVVLKWISIPTAKSMSAGIVLGSALGILMVKLFRIEHK